MSEHLYDDKKPLRIVHVLRAPLGGLFRHVVDLTRAQVERGHAVGLVTDSMTGGERACDLLASLAPALELGILRLPIHRNPGWSDAGAILKVQRHLQALSLDVVHGHGSKGGMLARLPGFLQRGMRPARCYTPHGGSFNYVTHPLIHSAYMGAERLLAARTDVLLFESVFIAQRFHQTVGDVKAIVRIVQNGISPTELSPVAPMDGAADFLYVGELRSAKGIDTLLEALARLSRLRNVPFKLILVGSGPDQDLLRRHAETLGISDQVSFPGPMPARDAFALGRMLVVPSRAESLPYIVLEAAGAQIPMIATDVGGIGEVFGPYRNRLIACNDPAGLASAMGHMLDTPPVQIRRQAQDLASFVAARFTIANMADAVISGYHDALSRRATPAHGTRPSLAIPH